MSKILQDVADVRYGKSQNGVSDPYGRFPIIGTGGFLGNARVSLFNGPAVVVGRKGTLNNPQYIQEDFWAVDTTYAVIPKENIHAKWLYFSLCNSRLELLNEATGVPSINRDRLFRIPVQDIDLPEQTRIAYVLDTIDEAIAKTEAVIEKLKQVWAGMLHDLLNYGLDEHGQLRDPVARPEQFKDSPLGRIPREWDVFELNELFDLQTGATPLRQQEKRFFYDGNIPWVKTLDLNENWIFKTDENITKVALNETSCRILPTKTILIAMYGGWEQIGRTGILGVPAATNQAICALVRKAETNNSEYIFRSLQYGRFRWKRFAASTRKDPNISKGDVAQFLVSIPRDRIEQDQICKLLALFDRHITSNVNELIKLMSIKYGLQDDLITGRIRIV